MSKEPLKHPELERIAQATSRVLRVSSKAMATQYLYGALEAVGLYFIGQPLKSKLKAWEIYAIADRSAYLANEVST